MTHANTSQHDDAAPADATPDNAPASASAPAPAAPAADAAPAPLVSQVSKPASAASQTPRGAFAAPALFCAFNGLGWMLLATRYPGMSDMRPDTLGAAFTTTTLIGNFFLFGAALFLLLAPLWFFSTLRTRRRKTNPAPAPSAPAATTTTAADPTAPAPAAAALAFQIAAIALGSAATGALLADIAVFERYRQHLDPAFAGMFFSPAGREIFTFPPVMYAVAGGVLAVVAAVETALLRAALRLPRGQRSARPVRAALAAATAAGAGCALASNLLHAHAAFTGGNAVLVRAELFPGPPPATARKLMKTLGFKQADTAAPPADHGAVRYPLRPLEFAPAPAAHGTADTAPAKPPNILFLFIDAWRADALDPETMPRLHARARAAAVFTRHASGGNATRCGLFSAFYAIPGTYWHSFLAAGKRPVLMETLASRGYDFAIYASAQLTNPEFDQTLFRAIPGLRTASRGKTTLERDTDAADSFLRHMETRDPARPFFGFLFYDALHAYALPPGAATPFQPAHTEVNYLALDNTSDPAPMRNLYKNAAFNLDLALDALLARLETLGALRDTILVITGDHGEEANETRTNAWGHNSNYSRHQIHVPLLVFWPGRPPERVGRVTTHFDLVPTLMRDALGCRSPEADYCSGKNLFDPAPRLPFVMSSYSTTAILHDGGVRVLRKYGGGENHDFDYLGEGTPISGHDLKTALEEMRRFRAPRH